jgi:hypothetical protein
MHSVAIAVAPRAPANLVATVKGGSLVLTWTDNSLNETSFTVQRAKPAAGPWTTLATLPAAPGSGSTLTFSDKSFKSNQVPYYYQVFGSNVVGDNAVYAGSTGFPTITMNSVPATVGPPAGVTTLVSLTQAASKGPVVVTWTYAPSGDQKGFTIQRATNAAFTAGVTNYQVAGTVLTYSDTKIKVGVTYYYRVMATNPLGNGTWSNALSILTI